MKLIVRRNAGIGDALAATIVAERLRNLGVEVTYQCHEITHPILKLVPWLRVQATAGTCDVDLDGAYERHEHRKIRHFYSIFLEEANRQLAKRGIHLEDWVEWRPRLSAVDCSGVLQAARTHPRPWIMICPRSDSYNTRQVVDAVWADLVPLLRGTLFWLGTLPPPKGYVWAKSEKLEQLARWISIAELLITVDTAPMHIAAGYGVPIVAIYQSFNPKLRLPLSSRYVIASPGLECLNCQLHKCPRNHWMPPCGYLNARLIANAAGEIIPNS